MSLAKEAVKIALAPVGLINKIIPKNPKKVVFYSNLGFRDNVLAMYEYFIKNKLNEDYKIIVATNDEKPEDLPKNVKYTSLFKGFFSFLTAKYCFYSFGKYPIKPAKSQRVVNLWHGMPLKSVGRLCKGAEKDDQNFFSHIIATSPFFADIMKKAFGARDNQIILTPQPRCDEILVNAPTPDFLRQFDKVFVWMPTVYSSKKVGLSDGDYGDINPFNEAFILRLNEFLKEKNSVLVIKPHPMDDAKALENKSNVLYIDECFLKQEKLSIYTVLKESDALITDFSSIFIDYVNLDKPIAFILENLESYKKSRGFVLKDAEKLMCGAMVKSKEDLICFFSDVINHNDEYKEKRRDCKNLFNVFSTQLGCEIILKEIGFKKTEDKL